MGGRVYFTPTREKCLDWNKLPLWVNFTPLNPKHYGGWGGVYSDPPPIENFLCWKKMLLWGGNFFHWLLIIFKYSHFGISFMVVVPSVAAQQPFCRQNFQILLLALQRILSSAQKSQIFKSIWSCISRDYFKFGCGYLLSIVGCIFVPKIFAPGGPPPILEGGGL